MNHRDRFLSAIKMKEPDRVPYFDYFDEISILNTANVLFGEDMPEVKSAKAVVDHRLDDETYKYQDLLFEIIKKLKVYVVSEHPHKAQV